MKKLVTAVVLGFDLVLDKNNGVKERISFSETQNLFARVRRIEAEDSAGFMRNPQNFNPTAMFFFTKFRRDGSGVIEEQDRVNVSSKVGDPAYLMNCQCGRTRWSLRRSDEPNPSPEYTCEDCTIKQSREDFNSYNGGDQVKVADSI